MKKVFLMFFLAVQAFMMSAQSTLRVEAPNMVAADEQFNVTFILDGEDSPSDFTWEPGNDFQLVWGPQKGRSSSLQIINGKRTKSTQHTFTYILLPKSTGTFMLPGASAKVKGKDVVSPDVSLEVVGGGNASSSEGDGGAPAGNAASNGTISEDDLFLRFTINRKDVVIGEPIVATLKLYYRVNIGGFEDVRFPSFNGFWSQEVEAPTNLEYKRENVDDKIYNTVVLRKYVLIPQQTGTLTIDPAELVCLVSIRVAQSRGASIFDGFFDDYRTIRKRVTPSSYKVNVSPLPAGAPASFGGGVGEFGITAALSKDSLKTHEAASLVITVKGRGNVSLLEAPKVSFPPDMEVYDIKVTERTDKKSGGTSGSKIYEFPFIPRSYGDFVLDPIQYSYYDINTGKYVVLSTPAISYHVYKSKDSIVPGGGVVPSRTDRTGVKSLNEDIRFVATKRPHLSSKGDFFVLSGCFWGCFGALCAMAVLMWLAFRKIAKRRADVAGTRTRKASKIAVRRLKSAGDYLRQNLYTAFYEELHKALLGYIADKLNISASELSKEQISSHLSAEGVPAETIDGFTSLIDECEFARYSPDAGHDAMARHYESAVKTISSIESDMKGKKKTGRSACMLAVLLMMSVSVTGYAAEKDVYIDSLWNKATAAYTEGLWDEAASLYNAVAAAGLESPELYCNIGNTFFKSENYPSAILYYERALKLDPSYSDARYNLEVVSDLVQDRIDPVPEFVLKSWTRNLCYVLDSDSWAILSLVFFGICLAMVLLFFLASGTVAKSTGFFTAIVFFLFSGASLGFSLWQRTDYMKADSAIVMKPVTSVKSAPSSGASTDLFVLHEGTKVKILDEVGQWRNISLADGRQGWMLSSDMEII